MWTNPGWFIYQVEVRIWFWSSASWPSTFLVLSFSTLYSSSLWRTNAIVFSKLNTPPAPLTPNSNELEINKPPGWGGNRGFTVLPFSGAFASVENPDCLSGRDLNPSYHSGTQPIGHYGELYCDPVFCLSLLRSLVPGYFRVTKVLFFKTKLSAKPFLGKWVLSA